MQSFRYFLETKRGLGFKDYKSIPEETKLIALDHIEEAGLTHQFDVNNCAEALRIGWDSHRILNKRLKHMELRHKGNNFTIYHAPALEKYCEFLHVNPRIHIRNYPFGWYLPDDWWALVTPEMVREAATKIRQASPHLFQDKLKGHGYTRERATIDSNNISHETWEALRTYLPSEGITGNWNSYNNLFHESGLKEVIGEIETLLRQQYPRARLTNWTRRI